MEGESTRGGISPGNWSWDDPREPHQHFPSPRAGGMDVLEHPGELCRVTRGEINPSSARHFTAIKQTNLKVQSFTLRTKNRSWRRKKTLSIISSNSV